MTIANGRWEWAPIPCDSAAGSNPSIATRRVIVMGRSLITAPSTAAPMMSTSGLVPLESLFSDEVDLVLGEFGEHWQRNAGSGVSRGRQVRITGPIPNS